MVPDKISQSRCNDIVSDVMREAGKSRPDLFFASPAIPEEITAAAEQAGKGRIPVIRVSSGLWQKAYYQIIHDICGNGLHAVLLVSSDRTCSGRKEYPGVFDFSGLSVIPELTLLAPKNRWELAEMLRWAADGEGPAAICCSDGGESAGFPDFCAPVRRGKSEIMYDEGDIALIAVGSMVQTAASVRNRLKEFGYGCSLINARFIKPLDEAVLLRTVRSHNLIVTLEHNIRCGGFGDRVLEYLNDIGNTVRVINIAIPDDFPEWKDAQSLNKEAVPDEDSILMRILSEYIGRRDLF